MANDNAVWCLPRLVSKCTLRILSFFLDHHSKSLYSTHPTSRIICSKYNDSDFFHSCGKMCECENWTALLTPLSWRTFILSRGRSVDMTYFLFSFVVETRRERALDGISIYRDFGRLFATHNSVTESWQDIPLPLSPVTWFQYYRELENVLRTCDEPVHLRYRDCTLCTFSHYTVWV